MSEEITQFNLKYRPRKWEDVVGQDTTVSALQKRLKTGDIPSAILFQGQYGTGKTTLAELFSACLVSPTLDANLNPDWNAPSCLSILNNTFDRDVQRLDGSQLSGKTDVIDFTRNLNLRPMYDKRKVLLIEEVDQISSAGMSSLLKILEGLKPWVTIILLSMEDKVSAAIKSRCQCFNIKSLNSSSIMLGLKRVMEKSNHWNSSNIPLEFRTEGLKIIADSSKGSMRTAVQYLEKCLVNEAYKEDQIYELLEVIDEAKTWKILDGLLDKTKDPTIWRSIMSLKTGDETAHFCNYANMILGEALICKETGFAYEASAFNRLNKLGNHPNCEALYNTLALSPLMTKPYIRTSDIVGALASYYRGNENLQHFEEKKVISPSKEETPIKEEKRMIIGVPEEKSSLFPIKKREIPVRTTLDTLDITF